jgi:hypothetical protein
VHDTPERALKTVKIVPKTQGSNERAMFYFRRNIIFVFYRPEKLDSKSIAR